MTIAVLVARYSTSGVPLAQIRLAEALARRGHEVDLLFGFAEDPGELPAVPGVEVRNLNQAKVRGLLAPLMGYLRRRRPDVVFSAEDHLNAILLISALAVRSKARISASSRVTPFDTYSDQPLSKRWALKQIMRLVGRRADALTCVSHDMVDQYRSVFPGARHVGVYNIVDKASALGRIAEPVDDHWFHDRNPRLMVAAGSLVPWKGYGELIDAVAILRDRGVIVRLAILGDGPLRGSLNAQIEQQGLADRVRLLGRVANPLKFFARAGLFALSSHVEGMPNVLVEAMMCGCTPVATDCPTGPRELLHGGRFGYLTPAGDPAGFADAIERALARPIAPAKLDEAIVSFSECAVLDRHFELLGLADKS